MKELFLMLAILLSTTLLFAQPGNKGTRGKATADTTTPVTIQGGYSCPMHPEVVSDKPGKCTKCSRPLTRSKKEQMKMEVVKLYTCPMHPGVSSAKPGTCPECGMSLVQQDRYTCPMHPDQVSTKAGNCPKCGMKMVVRKPTSDKADREIR
jgi:hypothetical protein